jgi:hypothetical protein
MVKAHFCNSRRGWGVGGGGGVGSRGGASFAN